jgi:hypothetical protein
LIDADMGLVAEEGASPAKGPVRSKKSHPRVDVMKSADYGR